ncbi:MAG: transketolase [Candidatus Binatia bacterium]|nr:transketolase [Candidatus Binatia bacterium]
MIQYQRKCNYVEILELETIAKELRVDIIRMLVKAGSGHPGGSLSCIDLVTTLFFHKMRHRPKEPDWSDRDRFVLSKGHCVPALYAALSRAGYFPRDELLTLRKLNSRIQGHPDRFRFPYLEASTGSLGQGLSMAVGMALAGKTSGKDYRVYCVISDGECQAGQIWEAAMSAAKFELDNLCVMLDYNKIQLSGAIKDIMNIEPLLDKWKSFNWNTLEIDGHDFKAITESLEQAEGVKGKPTLILCQTLKGKGVSFMEGKWEWHGKAPNREEGEKAIQEILA